jgi:hypothetical protein
VTAARAESGNISKDWMAVLAEESEPVSELALNYCANSYS